jgi:hypothetical protein
MKHTDSTIRFYLDCLKTPSEELSTWEEDFIESLTEQFDERGTLTDRQFEKLEDIYDSKG